jgi:hypothetical protein
MATPAVPTPEVELREAHFQDYRGMIALQAEQGLPCQPLDEWQRLWAGNPCYEEIGPRWPIGWVLEASGRIVGCVSNIPLMYSFRGRKLQAAAGRGWAVDPSFRDCADLLADRFFNQENVDLFLTVTCDKFLADTFLHSGAWRMPCGDWGMAAFAIVTYLGFAESLLRRKAFPLARLLRHPTALALALKDRVTGRGIPRTDIEVKLARDFDQRFDNFWEILGHRSDTVLAERSREALRWHFAAAQDRNQLWVLTAARNGNLDAYAVFQRHDDPEYGLKRVRMVDFQACDWHEQYCAALMQRAYDECRTQGIHVLEHVGCGVPQNKIFDESAGHRRKLANWSYFCLAREADLAGQLSQAAAWAPSAYDLDSSL